MKTLVSRLPACARFVHYFAVQRLALLVLVGSLLCVSQGAAQNSKDFSTVRFYPAAGQGNFITVEGARVAGHLRQSYGVFFDYAADTLVADKPCRGIPNTQRCENETTHFVAGTGLFHLLTAVTLVDRVQLAFDLPVGFTDSERFFTRVIVNDGASPARTFAPRQGFAFADARVSVKTQILGTGSDAFALSASAYTTLPTALLTSHGDCRDAGTCAFTGERGANAGALAIAEYRFPWGRAAANLGAGYRPHRRFVTRETGSELTYGLAGQYDITPLVHATAEVQGFVNLIGAGDYPIEARGAVSYGRDLVVLAGAGGGLYGDVGNPSYRFFVGLSWTPIVRDQDHDGIEDDDDACPSIPEDADGFMDADGCPELDNDQDGIPDEGDGCDNEREDVDGFEDEDGCPELDNDQDGVPDGYDSCEGEKEDLDGDHDDDGCPDFDTDRDGVRDDLDACPNQPEDTDGLADDDGCPEEDFDGDGLRDVVDACPDQAETWNGILDEDGCPEDDGDGDGVPDQLDACEQTQETLNGFRDQDGCPDGASVITVSGARITPLVPLQFDGDHLRSERPLLNTLADFVRRNHQRGTVHVQLTAPKGPVSAARVEILAKGLAKRLQREVSSGLVEGTPSQLQIELRAPGYQPPRPPPAAKGPTPAPAAQEAPTAPAPSPPAPLAPTAPAPTAPAPPNPPAQPPSGPHP